MTAEWFYAKNKQKVGPVTEEQVKELLRTGELSPGDMVWKQGMAKWQPAGGVDGLLPTSPPSQPGPPPLPDATAPVGNGSWEKLKRNRPVFLTALLAVAMFGSCLGIPVVSWVTSVLPEGAGGFLGFLYALFMVGLFLALLVTGMTALDAREIPEFPGSHFPWAAGERTAANVKLLGLRVGVAVSAVIGLAFLVSIVGSLFCLPFFSLAILIYGFGLRRGRLHGRWVPAEGQGGWVEFVSGGIFKKEDGTVGTFVLLPNQRFIDLVASGHLVNSWRILTWGGETLEVQDMQGATRNFKKGKTFEEKQASLFHRERSDDLPGTWMPIDGSGEWVQFTKDGAIVFSEGGAGRYTLTGEEPNEIIQVTMADGSTREYRVMSLSKAQLVIVEGSEARTYTRHGTKTAAASRSSEDEQVPSEDPPADQGTSSGVGGLLSGVWNWISGKWPCPNCKSRNTKVVSSKITDRRQEVHTDFSQGALGHHPQAMFNIYTHHDDCQCKNCGHEWIQEHTTRLKA